MPYEITTPPPHPLSNDHQPGTNDWRVPAGHMGENDLTWRQLPGASRKNVREHWPPGTNSQGVVVGQGGWRGYCPANNAPPKACKLSVPPKAHSYELRAICFPCVISRKC